ncbi:MAG: transcription antitermination factor NusB [Beijerinckiaceae bacterium]|jgi:N utilization substance protein B|nr:transcription antitermination factor NusB [Beijerinckiaceae bacterium]
MIEEGKKIRSRDRSVSRGEKRAAARLAAVQALYQMEIAGKGLNEVFAEFESFWMGREIEGDQYKPAEAALFRHILEGVLNDQVALDRAVDRILEGWPLKRIEAIMRATLRAGAFELKHGRDVPPRVILSEYVDIASAFLEKDEVGMVNAVLDKLARDYRAEDLAKPAPTREG